MANQVTIMVMCKDAKTKINDSVSFNFYTEDFFPSVELKQPFQQFFADLFAGKNKTGKFPIMKLEYPPETETKEIMASDKDQDDNDK